MQGRKYLIVLLLAWVVILLWGATALREPFRLAFAERFFHESYVEKGAKLYAENCVTCHGPVGEGVVGPPLNREEFHGTPTENADVYDMLYNTIARGRPGTTSPKWVKLPDGSWASYTQMPQWLNDAGGPLNDQQVKQLVTFIMNGDFSQVSSSIPKPNLGENNKYITLDTSYMSLEDQQRAQEIFETAGGSGCVTCHTIGSRGGNVGPNLSDLGAWGLDEEFLTQWIKDPQNTPNRMPTHFSNFGGPLMFPHLLNQAPQAPNAESSGTTNQSDNAVQIEIPKGIEYPSTVMPPLQMTDEERALLVKYLLGLGVVPSK